MAKKKHRKWRGHYCWSCQRYLANERSSGRGHRNHLCKQCSKLGTEELEYRQAVIDIDRCLGWGGHLKRHHRRTFERYRDHPNERVRRYIEELEADWAEDRRLFREMCEQEEA